MARPRSRVPFGTVTARSAETVTSPMQATPSRKVTGPVTCRLLHTPTSLNPLGARGAGDVGFSGAVAAAVSAVRDALGGAALPTEAKAPEGSAVEPTPANSVDLPLLPERLWRCLTAGEAEGEDG